MHHAILFTLLLATLPVLAQDGPAASPTPAASPAPSPNDSAPAPNASGNATEVTEQVTETVAATAPDASGNATITEQVTESVTETSGNTTVTEEVTATVEETVTASGNVTQSANATSEDVIPLPQDSAPADAPIVSEGEVTPAGSDASFLDPASAPANEDLAVNPDLPPAPSGPTAGEQSRALKVRYQEVRTEAEKDPAVRAMREKASKARTFEDERAALREYYRLLFARMRKIDKSLSARCDVMERAYIARLAQTRLEPTIPLNPPPTPESLAD